MPPAVGAADLLPHRVGAVAEALQVTVLEIDARSVALRREPHFHLRDQIGVVGKIRRDLPDQHHARGWLPCQDLPDLALGSIDSDLIPTAARTWLDHRQVEVGLPDMMRFGPPAA